MKKPVIAMCMPIGSKIDPLTFQSHRYLDRAGLEPWHHFEMIGFPVETARNEITWAAINDTPEVTHLFWVDSDMVFGPNALKRLLAHDLDFVGGLCFDRRHPYKPVIARNFDPRWGFEPGTHGWLFDYPPNQVIEVDGTGGAFLLIKREVFEKVREQEANGDKAYRDWWKIRGDGLSEDLAFCKRAQKAGFKLHVDTGCKIGHIGQVVVNEDFARRNREFEYGQWHTYGIPGAGVHETLEDAARMNEPSPTTKAIDEGFKKPLVSIVIPTYNQKPEWLHGAIASALSQTVPCEIIVVDDGSDLAVGPIAVESATHTYKLITNEKNKGVAAALNIGLEYMTTDWFCWLPSDDMFEPKKVEIQLACLLATRRLCGYHGFTLKLDNANQIAHVRIPQWTTREEQNKALAQVCAINGTTVMIHRSVFEKVGRFDESYKYSQDWELWCRIGQEFDWHGMSDKLAMRREFANLTKAIAADNEKKAARDAEDARIKEKYKR